MSKISIIAAVDRQMAIGFQNKLLFWLPNDLKHFKTLTTGHTVLMGRKTFESLPKGALPNRRNIVLSSHPETRCEGAEVFTSIEDALQHCGEEEHIYIIGGASIYRQALPLADELCLTEINDTAPEADAYFPNFSSDEWQEKSREVHPADEKHLCSYVFVDYIRK
ncbi:dihydrofolate reductase [gut metagenome]|uniref:dihydrofolate reductase n=1 Tax=gut metagenome TaxID=749906 RepID=J9GTZ1_9ZZZZ